MVARPARNVCHLYFYCIAPALWRSFFANLPRVSGICEAFSYHIGFYSVVEAHDPGNSPAKAVDGIQGGKLGLLSAWYYVYYTYRASLLLLFPGGTG